jgi:hypothetical protein
VVRLGTYVMLSEKGTLDVIGHEGQEIFQHSFCRFPLFLVVGRVPGAVMGVMGDPESHIRFGML